MVWLTFYWIPVLLFYSSVIFFTDSLPIINVSSPIPDVDLMMSNLPEDVGDKIFNIVHSTRQTDDKTYATQLPSVRQKYEDINATVNEIAKQSTQISRHNVFSEVRPGQEVTRYVIEITRDGNSFRGRAILTVQVNDATRENDLKFHCQGLTIQSVQVGMFTEDNAANNNFNVDNDILEIEPNIQGSLYVVIIEYTAALRNDDKGLFISNSDENDYIAMNLHPINARRVFPCVDETPELSTVSFTFNDMGYTNMVSNSMLEENSETAFRPLQGSLHLWGMVAHNLNFINIPIVNVLLYIRPGITNQEGQASVAINFYFTNLNEWTQKEYTDIILNQDGRMHIFALPDTNTDWYALSTVCIWEPYILMTNTHSVKQRVTALSTIAEAMSRQWFGFVLFPENWRHQWVITGLAKYAGFEMMRRFQGSAQENDVSVIDVDTVFTSDIFQESLFRDAHITSQQMLPSDNIFDEHEIRDFVNGNINYKAPAIMRMLRLVLSDDEVDYIQVAANALLATRALNTVNTRNFIDAIDSGWLFDGNDIIDNVADFLEPYLENNGYPMVNVDYRQNSLRLTQEYFTFTPSAHVEFEIPISFTTSINPNFDDIHPQFVMGNQENFIMELGEEDWVLLNIQGQGYYRVNYVDELWENIIEALEDPEEREIIHPLNRATLVDDALNLARASKLDYGIAFQVVLAMEHETEYAPWKAFVRNMNFLKRHLVAMVTEDEDLDPDIYLRMVRRTIGTFEDEIGFSPDPQLNEAAMVSLTRGLVMDHACRANYVPCIAAAIDWFYDPNDDSAINPNIPHDIRPAVYCTMVREGDDDIIEMLEEQLEIEVTHYERIVIMESMACSDDNNFIRSYLQSTIAEDSPYSVVERSRIFKAVAGASYENTNTAIAFVSSHTREIRNMYGGDDKLEEVILTVADNIAEPDQFDQFRIWVNSINSFLDDSQDVAERALTKAQENMRWNAAHLEAVYEWIDENGAPSFLVSSLLIFISLCVALFNR